jgi:NADH:ubiquinone oxidoreductase subunit 4 (subunit M)
VWITGAGMVLVAAFTLRALKQSFFGERSALGGSTASPGDAKSYSASPTFVTSSAERSIHPPDLAPITLVEKCGACLLMFATLAVGLYPKLLLDRIMPAVEAMRFLSK